MINRSYVFVKREFEKFCCRSERPISVILSEPARASRRITRSEETGTGQSVLQRLPPCLSRKTLRAYAFPCVFRRLRNRGPAFSSTLRCPENAAGLRISLHSPTAAEIANLLLLPPAVQVRNSPGSGLVWQSAFPESLDMPNFYIKTDSHASVATLARNDSFWGLFTQKTGAPRGAPVWSLGLNFTRRGRRRCPPGSPWRC